LGQKGQFEKKRFFRFYAKIAADIRFWSAALKKMQPITKSQNFQNALLNFLSTFQFSATC